MEGLVDSAELKTTITHLIIEKRKGREADPLPRIQIFHEFIAQEFTSLEEKQKDLPKAPGFPLDVLNDLFRASLEKLALR